ncbi:unnamed protein product, partial [marine sediment metagenome]
MICYVIKDIYLADYLIKEKGIKPSKCLKDKKDNAICYYFECTQQIQNLIIEFEKIKEEKLEEGLVKDQISGQMSILDLKKFRPVSKTKSLIPKTIFDISKKVNISQLKITDYIGIVETEEYGKMEKWQKKDIGYLVKTEDFIEKMNRQLPKPDALMDKVLKILIYLIQQEANKSGKDITEAEISFYSKDIAKYLGLGEQIKKSGEFNKSLKRTLISGHCTHYEYPHKIDGVNYRYYGTFFDVDIPEDSKHKWTLYFNG